LSFVLGQHKEEDDDKQLFVIVFCNTMQNKREKKLTKGGRVQSVPRDIEDGNGTMELMLKQVMTMAHWSSH
jgi:hypothetical protein